MTSIGQMAFPLTRSMTCMGVFLPANIVMPNSPWKWPFEHTSNEPHARCCFAIGPITNILVPPSCHQRTWILRIPFPMHLGLPRPEELHTWTPDIASSLVCQPLDPLNRVLSFEPEAKLTWYHQTVCMVSHHFDVSHSSLPQDPIFYFVAFLHELNPLTWAWHSSDCTPMTVPPTTWSEKLQDQLTDIN